MNAMQSKSNLAYNTPMQPSDLVLALTGASGAVYGVRLLEVMLQAGRRVQLVISPSAVQVVQQELSRQVRVERFRLADLLGKQAIERLGPAAERVDFQQYQNMLAGIASGSFPTAGMAVCPCSMGTAAAIAHGLSQNLIQRAA